MQSLIYNLTQCFDASDPVGVPVAEVWLVNLKVILDIYRVPILVGSLWMFLLRERGWGKTLKHLQFQTPGILGSLATYGFLNSHGIALPLFSQLYLQ